MSFWGTGLPVCHTPNPQQDIVSFSPPKFALVTLANSLPKRSILPTRQTCVGFLEFWREPALIEACKPFEVLSISSGAPGALSLGKIYSQMSRLQKGIVFLSYLPFRGRIVLFIFIFVESRAVFKRLILKRDQVRIWFQLVGIFLQLNQLLAVLELRPTQGPLGSTFNLKVTNKVMTENHKREL